MRACVSYGLALKTFAGRLGVCATACVLLHVGEGVGQAKTGTDSQ